MEHTELFSYSSIGKAYGGAETETVQTSPQKAKLLAEYITVSWNRFLEVGP